MTECRLSWYIADVAVCFCFVFMFQRRYSQVEFRDGNPCSPREARTLRIELHTVFPMFCDYNIESNPLTHTKFQVIIENLFSLRH